MDLLDSMDLLDLIDLKAQLRIAEFISCPKVLAGA
jgi:hypothetical protein